MAIALVVTQPFGSYAKGDRITDTEAVQQVLRDHHVRVVKIHAPDPTPPAASPAAEPPKA